uniref:Putative secreted protein n=1 Tax=Ixodes ricinus TaxID=34613 RepID=A0A0K8RA02_IXORI
MLLLKVILVVLISEIDSGPAPSVTEIEKAPESLPQESLINNTEPNGCKYQLLPYWSENGMESGFLTVDCEKNCPEGTHETAVDGNPCVLREQKYWELGFGSPANTPECSTPLPGHGSFKKPRTLRRWNGMIGPVQFIFLCVSAKQTLVL